MSDLYPELGNSRITPIWQPQPGPQTDLVTCPVFEVFYGGARGGGKTEASIGDWFLHSGQWGERAAGLFVRRKLTQLSDAIKRFRRYGAKIGAKWHEQKKELTMPNGAVLKFAYLERDEDAEEYQGHEYTRIYVEEVTNFPFPDPIMKLKGSCRSSAGIPCGIRLTGNPGGPGHHWVKARYIDPAPKGYLVIEQLEKIEIEDGVFVESIIDRVFIPAKLKDNKELLRNDPGYVQRLRETGSAALVKAWLEGDWDGVDGTFFSEFSEEKHVLRGVLQLPAHWTKFRAMDWGSAAPFSVGWYAVSDGEILAPRGALIKYAEWYGWNGQPNKGLKMSADSVARGIINREKDMKQRLSYGVADPSIFSNNGGPSIAEMMMIAGCGWIRGDNARQAGWEQMRKRLAADEPLLLFHESCEHTIRTLPYLQHDDKNPEDLNSDSEDHCFLGATQILTKKGVFSLATAPEAGEVWTERGWRPYRNARLTKKQAASVKLFFNDGTEIQCTPEHRFKVVDSPDEMRYAKDLLNSEVVCHPPSFLNQFKSSLGSVITIAEATFKTKVPACIEKCGKPLMGLYPKTIMSITRTGIVKIMPWPIWNVFLGPSTFPSAHKNNLTNIKPLGGRLDKKLLQSGMVLKKVMNGMGTTMSGIFALCWKNLQKVSALSVRSRTKFRQCTKNNGFSVMPTAKPVRCVRVEPAEPIDVYCLTVPSTGTFCLLNGMVVSNCVDETRYAVMSRPTLRDKPKVSETDLTKARAMPTINELLAGSIKARQMEEQRY